MTIGLQEAVYEVRESDPSVRVCAELTAGEAAITVEVSLMTDQSGNADGILITELCNSLVY